MRRLASGAVAGLLLASLSGCTYMDPVTARPGTQYTMLTNTPKEVGKMLPDRPLYIHFEFSSGSSTLTNDDYLPDAFMATGMFREVKLSKDPYPPADSYLLKRSCYHREDARGVGGILWLLTAFVVPGRIVHHHIQCNNEFSYVPPDSSTYPLSLYRFEQNYSISEYGNGFGVIPFLARGKKAEQYNPVAIANDTVRHVLWGLQ